MGVGGGDGPSDGPSTTSTARLLADAQELPVLLLAVAAGAELAERKAPKEPRGNAGAAPEPLFSLLSPLGLSRTELSGRTHGTLSCAVAIALTTTLPIVRPTVPVEKAAVPKTMSHLRKLPGDGDDEEEEEEEGLPPRGSPRLEPVGSVWTQATPHFLSFFLPFLTSRPAG